MNRNIVFFDGVCHLCHGAVNLLLRIDSRKRLYYAPLQGASYQELCTQHPLQTLPHPASLATIVFLTDDGRIFTKSDAAVRIGACLGGVYRLALVLLLVPRFFRDALYDWVSGNRYHWFGKDDSCRIPHPDEAARFLL
ncbi:MAG: DUF393 domain-containing protein [Candidatus Kapaibacterium sp.]|nr:MAG: DUF393 domain-containing protein [Candidatus Kapabacteria bacterium]